MGGETGRGQPVRPAHQPNPVPTSSQQCSTGSGQPCLDSSSQATTIVHQIFGGFPRSRETMQFISRYRCLSLQASNGLWCKMNDPSVDGCGTDTVLRQQGYLLFYVR
ncbi:hypothetical protein QYF61_005497 [Mycteria americana]|uniref:Uncharacterized protein n=1 Tax=Mycteria americana TaxID=33587 RepID=A0AAN7N196_MYCAM|nr:hypothetical protein QYF61_005497 [Mycteria americana]